MILSPQRNFIFIHIRKTAGTAVTRAYDKVALFDDLILGSTAHGDAVEGYYRDRYNLRKHSTWMELSEIIGLDRVENAFTFATVRNPWSWVVSHYTSGRKRATPTEIGKAAQELSFEDFLRSPALEDLSRRVPQYKYVCDEMGELAVDLLIRQENLGEDWAELCDRLGITGVSLSVENRSNESDWRGFYTRSADVDQVGELFGRDASMFGYSFE